MHQRSVLFWPLVRLTVLFILCQVIVAFITADLSHHGAMATISQFLLQHAVHSSTVWLGIVYFLFVQFSLYCIFILCIYWGTKFLARQCKLSDKHYRLLGLSSWTIAVCFIMLANTYFYPRSRFAFLGHLFPSLHSDLGYYTLWLLGSFIVILAVCAVLEILSILLRKSKYLASAAIGLSIIILVITLLPRPSSQSISTQPNIIIIGIDSLRPDHLQYFGAEKNLMPHLEKQLATSTVFAHAYTPLGRTFPAWVSILTGEYPKTNGARVNLQNPQMIKHQDSIAFTLQQAGYHTIYATDERWFNNIDESYSFDTVIGPHYGMNDFLFSSINDFPLSNLLMNFAISHYLFPYNYANRAANVTYYPESFSHLLNHALKANHDKPLFLAVHFCLPHWTYTWAQTRHTISASTSVTTLRALYNKTLGATDQQIATLLKQLKKQGYLDHALVVLLSDHGQAFAFKNDRPSKGKYQASQTNQKALSALPR